MMTVVIESDHVMYLSALNMRSDWFFLVQCSLQTKTNEKVVLWQRHRTYDAVVKFDTGRNLQRHRTVRPAIGGLSCFVN